MKNKSLLITLTIVVSLLCLYYLSFTFISRGVEKDAIEFATTADGKVNVAKKQAYLDSVWTEPVFLNFTYKEVKQYEVKLGLDLLGGMHITMEVSAADIINVLSNNNKNAAYQKALKEAQQMAVSSQKPFVTLFFERYQAQNSPVKLAAIFANKGNRDRIDFQSDDQTVLKYLNEEVDETIDRSFVILRNRIDKFGVTQPNIQKLQGTDRIQIELPGVENPERVRKLLQGVAKLEFYEVYENDEFGSYFQKLNDYLVKEEKIGKPEDLESDTKELTDSTAGESLTEAADSTEKLTDETASTDKLTDDSDSSTKQATASTTDTASKKKEDAASATSKFVSKYFRMSSSGIGATLKDTAKIKRLFARKEIELLFPSNMRMLWGGKAEKLSDTLEVLPLYAVKVSRENKAPLEGDVISEAYQDFSQSGEPEVYMQMNSTGAKKWRKLTAANVNRRIAIVLDNYVYSAPVVRGEIPNGSSSISGNFTIDEAKDLANKLKAGKLPVPARIVEEAVVGPTLGQESINQGLLSIVFGFITILLFMIAYYSRSGLVADLAVLLNVFLILGILVPVGAVLTLPGIAGIVLTIGMAVDANVLINERIKDELRGGASMANAVKNGYSAASSSIWDANITTVLAAIVLFYFGSGPVQGFATTLIIGIFTSLFTSIYITRIVIENQIEKNKNFSFYTGATRDFLRHINFDFVSKRKVAYISSIIVLALGFSYIGINGLNYGVDFKGGWKYVVEFSEPMAANKVREALNKPLEGYPEVKTFGSANKLQITTAYQIDNMEADISDKVEAKVRVGLDELAKGKYQLLSSSKVGPTVANDIKTKAYYSIVLATLLIFAYIWFRFRKWEYAMGATLAVFHDAFMVIIFYSVLKDLLPFSLEIDQNFIAALLTVVGYSVNDTVVVFDRVREFFKDSAVDADPEKVINKALNDTFSRTIITASTVLLVILILLLFGGETIRGMSFALLIGTISGTYSTVFIAIPFVIDARRRKKAAIDA